MDKLDRRFLGSFKAETSEHLQALNKGLLELEQEPDATAVLESLLREIHTIKGSAAMIEFDSISDIAHSIEDVLIEIKDRRVEVGAVSSVLFDSLDAIETLLDAEIQGAEPKIKSADLVSRLEEAQNAEPSGSADTPKQIGGLNQFDAVEFTLNHSPSAARVNNHQRNVMPTPG